MYTTGSKIGSLVKLNELSSTPTVNNLNGRTSGLEYPKVFGPVLFLIFINDIDFIRHLITVLKKEPVAKGANLLK